jgi:formylglycine-generating enzyme required for sulfatase activity
MIKRRRLKPLTLLTLLLFIYPILSGNMAFNDGGDILFKARMLIREGDFEGAVKELDDVISKLETLRSQKEKVAEAHYLLARIYKIVQMEEEFQKNLKMAFEIYPDLSIDEPDPEIRAVVTQIKARLEKERVIAKESFGKKKKKKFPVLAIAAGVAVVTAAMLLLKKKKDSDNGAYDTNVLGIQWVDIPAGEFSMGDNFNDGWIDEQPVHAVYLDAYKISRYEVTFAQYDRFCDETGRNKPDDFGWGRENRPVIDVSWEDAGAFCVWLTGKTGKNIRLPSEAQWEKAARGTDRRKYPWGNDEPTCIKDLTNFNSCKGRTMPVGSFVADVSPYGVYDMAGNVFEWCADWYDASYYSSSPAANPVGPVAGTQRIHRGGSWNSELEHVRCCDRDSTSPADSSRRLGFRICHN